MSSKVSVCIPNYNQGSFISDAIQSVLNQTFTDFELIIVDNCSTDNSEEVIKSFSDPRIRFYKNERNIGMTANWNKCISLARGEYICILCADDKYSPYFLEKGKSILDASPNVGFVHSAFNIINEEGKIVKICWPWNWKRNLYLKGSEIFKRILVSFFATIPSVMMFRRSCFETLGKFDDELLYSQCRELVSRIALHYDMVYLGEPLACVRLHSETAGVKILESDIALIENIKEIQKILSNIPEGSKLTPLKDKKNEIIAIYILRLVPEYMKKGATKMARLIISRAFYLGNFKIKVICIPLFLITFFGGKIFSLITTYNIAFIKYLYYWVFERWARNVK